MTLEWIPSVAKLKYVPPKANGLSEAQEQAIKKAFTLFDVSDQGALDAASFQLALKTTLSVEVSDQDLKQLLKEFGNKDGLVDLAGLKRLLQSGRFREEQIGREYVVVSLAEAETIRRIMHLRLGKALIEGADTACALHCSAHSNLKFDESLLYAEPLSEYQQQSAWQVCRFINSEMFYSEQQLNTLIRALQNNDVLDRRRFFQLILACRRRTKKRFQESPLAKVQFG